MRSVIFALLAGCLLFSGCRTTAPVQDAALPFTLSESFSLDSGTQLPLEHWWLFLDSEELNHLMAQALEHNFDLQILSARIDQARAAEAKSAAALFPTLNFSAGGQRKGTQVKPSAGSSSRYDGSHSWNSSLSGDYTADIWGEADADRKVQALGHQAAQQDLRATTLEITVRIAEAWVDIIAARSRHQILERQVETNKTLLELLKLRFVNGRASALEVSQQQEALAEARAQLPLIEKQERLLLNQLALLTGKPGILPLQIQTRDLPETAALPKTGYPSDLLQNRPDIQAAQLRLAATQWDITAAKADLLPSFTLTAQALFSSGKLDLLFHNWVATLAGSIAGPLFDGGLRRAEVDRLEAVARERLNQYAAAVAGAVLEVETALISIQKQDEYIRLLKEELAVARIALKDARVQHQNGQSSYLNYLVIWSGIQRLERQLVSESASAVKERIRLQAALGWQPVFSEHINENAEPHS